MQKFSAKLYLDHMATNTVTQNFFQNIQIPVKIRASKFKTSSTSDKSCSSSLTFFAVVLSNLDIEKIYLTENVQHVKHFMAV